VGTRTVPGTSTNNKQESPEAGALIFFLRFDCKCIIYESSIMYLLVEEKHLIPLLVI
jgi:hypothetical protein